MGAARGLTILHCYINLLFENFKYNMILMMKKKTDSNHEFQLKGFIYLYWKNIKSKLYNLIMISMCVSIISCLIFSFVISGIYTLVSSYNYPGGHAITILTNKLIPHRHTTVKLNGVKLYLDVASAMTGVSEFEQHEFMNHVCISHNKIDEENDSAS